MPRPLAWLGRFHPLLTHFPIALLMAALAAELLLMRTGAVLFEHAVRFSIWLGAGGAAAAESLVEDQRFLTEGAVEGAWAELGFARQALGITSRNLDQLRQLSATAESRYRVGSGLQQDVLRAQVELTALLQERLRREEAIERAESELVALLDLPTETRLPPISELRMSAKPPALESILVSLDDRSARLRVHGAQPRLRELHPSGRLPTGIVDPADAGGVWSARDRAGPLARHGRRRDLPCETPPHDRRLRRHRAASHHVGRRNGI